MTGDGHKVVMRHLKPGMKEYQCESLFLNHCYYFGGCRYPSSTCVASSGHNSSILVYGDPARPNNKIISHGDMVLLDMGSEYCHYASDLTSRFVRGKNNFHTKLD